MRRVFIFVLLSLMMSLSSVAKNKGKDLSDLLLSFMQLEDVHPDSLERNIDSLKQCRLQSRDAAERAVYAAAIGRLYAGRMHWRSVGTDLRDSAVCWYGRSLADREALAQTKAKRWNPFVTIGKDEDYFDGDMLNVVWRSMTEQLDRNVRDTAHVLPKYGDMIDFYRQRGQRNAAFLLALDSLYNDEEEVTDAALLRLRDQYADLSLSAIIYLRMGTDGRRPVQQQRELLQQGLSLYPKFRFKAALQNALIHLSDPIFQWEGPAWAYPGKQYVWKFQARNIRSVVIDGQEHRFPDCDPIEQFTDSLLWTAPKPGEYEITFVPRVGTKVREKVEPLKRTIHVSALQMVYQLMPDDRVRVLVVDSETGEPQQGVTVEAFRPDIQDTILYFTGHTNTEGKLIVPRWKSTDARRWNSRVLLRMSRADERHLPITSLYLYNNTKWKGAPTDSTRNVELFTDRNIYRPGQTVRISGIEYSQLDWEARVVAGEKHRLRLYDSQHKQVEEKEVEADGMGVFSAEFLLPTDRRNGYFLVEDDAGGAVHFRVEEYKRPTFEVVLDDSLFYGPDSCAVVRGVARSYDGTPLRGARVTGTYRWQMPWVYWGKRVPQNETLLLDTLETDDNGAFAYELKVGNPRLGNERLRSSLSVSVDVLSQQGETHNARHWYWRRGEPQPKAEPQKVDSTFLVSCPVDSFSVDSPGRIEVTSCLHDVYLHYTFSAAGQVWKDEMVRLSAETFTLPIPYDEQYDQSLTVSLCFVKHGRVYSDSKIIRLSRPDNRLRVHWDTFRDLLQPGQQEEWRMTLRRPDGTPADANVMVAMYDASLDYFNNGQTHRWQLGYNRWHRTYSVLFHGVGNNSESTAVYGWYSQKVRKERGTEFSHINSQWFEVGAYTRGLSRAGGVMYKNASNRMMVADAAPMMAMATASASEAKVMTGYMGDDAYDEDAVSESTEEESDAGESETQALAVPIRENFQETAFFYPRLRTDKDGQVFISFVLPESLTRWNLVGMAHTQDMMYANLSEQIEARKDLMAQLYLPRFLRPGDEAVLTAMVRNVSEQSQQGKGVMQILDAKTEKVLKQWKADIRLAAKKDTVLHYPYSLPLMEEQEGALIVRWAVEGTTCSDGEQRLLPVLSPTEHITQTLALTAYNAGVSNYDLSSIFPAGATGKRLTVEYTTHPEQYALQALPVLAKAKHNDLLSISTAYYAGVLGRKLGVDMPDSTEAYLQRITDLQESCGAFCWHPQMPTSPYLTREVSFLLTRLYILTGEKHAEEVNAKAIHYLLTQRIDSVYLSVSDLRTLYVALYSGVRLSKEEQKKVDFLLKLAKREDVDEDGYERQALLAIVLKQAGADRKARKCINAFRKYLVSSPDRGTYIEFPKGSFASVDRKLHIHVQLMEALQRMNPSDTLLTGMRRYLLQQKRTQEWSTPVNSANAVFALLSNTGKSGHSERTVKDLLTLTRKGKAAQNFTAQDDTLGYLRDSLEITDTTLPLKLRLHKFSTGESWGGVYADFEQPFSEVEAHATGLSVTQEYPREAKTGSRYIVRYRITADRDYEYVTLSVPRPAFTEPVNQRSGYGWSSGGQLAWGVGLGYYRQVHDSSTEFSFYQIPCGEYLIEETLYVERDGSYHTGVATIRCEYAEEFQGHSGDNVVKVVR